MKEEDRWALALVEVRQAQAVDLPVMRLEGEVREALECLRGRAHDVCHSAAEHTRRLIG